jgi:hypothetical protein
MIERHEQGKPGVLNRADAEECEDQGWAEAQPGGGYHLTVKGRQILEAGVNEVEGD